MKKTFFIAILFLCYKFNVAQNVGINNSGASPDPTAILDIVSTDKGILIPRVALTSTTDIVTIPTPTISLMIYNTATASAGITAVFPGYYYWDGTVWKSMTVGGQSSTSYFSTAGLTVTSATALTFLPGYPVTLTVPVNSAVVLSADCGVQTTAAGAAGFSIVDVVIVVDGFILTDACYQRIVAANNTGLTGIMDYASMSQSVILTPGAHTFGIAAAGVGIGSNANVGGNSSSVLQSELTVTFIKQ